LTVYSYVIKTHMIELPEKKEARFTSEVLFPEKIGKIQSIIEGLDNIKYPVRYGFYVQRTGENEFLIKGAKLSRFLFFDCKSPWNFDVATVKLESFEGKTKISFEYDGSGISSRDFSKSTAKDIFSKITNAIYSSI
jgi:hypothetical protein